MWEKYWDASLKGQENKEWSKDWPLTGTTGNILLKPEGTIGIDDDLTSVWC